MHVRHQPKGVSKRLLESAQRETRTHTESLINLCPAATILRRLQRKEEEEAKETEKEHRRVREH